MKRLKATALVLSLIAFSKPALASPQDYFAIRVVDDQTGRGIPLVYLTSVYRQVYVTDSNGYVAFNEPGLMNGVDVWLKVRSYGYDEPPGAFGITGVRVKPAPGQSVEIRLKRRQIAERLYRMTGYGIYRDSVLLGKKPPTPLQLLNAQVTGSDTVQCAVYRGKLMWMWQDTDRVGFELGNFSMTGATTELPPKINPDIGLKFDYFATKPGDFAKPMAHVPVEGSHPLWVDGLTVVKDSKGRERLFGRYVAANKDFSPVESGLVLYDDEKNVFKRFLKFEGPYNGRDTLSPNGHAVYVRDGGTRYVYYGNNVRVRADYASVGNPSEYEAFTCLTPDGKAKRNENKLVWAWVKGTVPVNFGNCKELVSKNVIKAEESPYVLKDADSGRSIEALSAGIAWNDYLKCWINVFGQRGGDTVVGEIWISYANSPEGSWANCRKIATHAMEKNNNDFYNPVQHYELASVDGRFVYFSGTLVNTFSGNPWPTPYYNYNNLVYRLDLSDPRLKLPPAPPGLTGTKPARPGD